MEKEIEPKEVVKQAIIIPDDWWDIAWKGYIKDIKEKGLMVDIGGVWVDRNSLISSDILHKKCDI